MMLSNETMRKFNAISTCISMIQDAGIDKAEFYLKDLEDSEVEQISKDNQTVLYRPSHIGPRYWTEIHKGVCRIYVQGREKEISFTDIKQQ